MSDCPPGCRVNFNIFEKVVRSILQYLFTCLPPDIEECSVQSKFVMSTLIANILTALTAVHVKLDSLKMKNCKSKRICAHLCFFTSAGRLKNNCSVLSQFWKVDDFGLFFMGNWILYYGRCALCSFQRHSHICVANWIQTRIPGSSLSFPPFLYSSIDLETHSACLGLE